MPKGTTARALKRRDVLSLAALAPLARIAGTGVATGAPVVQSSAQRRRDLYALLGDLPDRKRPIGGSKRWKWLFLPTRISC